MRSNSIDFDLLFDADEYFRTEYSPWTFFAYPTSLAVEKGLPPDEPACQMLGEIQSRGIEVAIWINGIGNDTNYFCYKKHDIHRLMDALSELEASDRFGENYLSKRCDELFELLE